MLSRPSEHSTDEGEKLVARVKALSVPRVQVRDPARLADPVAPSAPVELDDEGVVAREHRLVRRGRQRGGFRAAPPSPTIARRSKLPNVLLRPRRHQDQVACRTI